MMTPKMDTVHLVSMDTEQIGGARERITRGRLLSTVVKAGCKLPTISTTDTGAKELVSEMCGEHFTTHAADGANRLWCGLTLRPISRPSAYIYTLQTVPGTVGARFLTLSLAKNDYGQH